MNQEDYHAISQVGGTTTAEHVSKDSASAPVTAYNMRCPAVKRLMREAAELSNPENDYTAQPTESNLFDWHFTIKGPEGSEFENGVYHGRIIFPSQYPMKPPSIMFLTPQGRFQPEEKICLSISNYHPETWLPSWSIRTALVALRSFMTTPGDEGSIGSLNFTVEERRKLAWKSRSSICHECGPILKLLPPRPKAEVTGNRGGKDAPETGTSSASTTAATSVQNSDAAPSQETPASVSIPKRKQAKDSINETSSPANAVNTTDNQGATSTASADMLQVQQPNEPVKNILYDLGIGCFVILILALCMRRLMTLFLRL